MSRTGRSARAIADAHTDSAGHELGGVAPQSVVPPATRPVQIQIRVGQGNVGGGAVGRIDREPGQILLDPRKEVLRCGIRPVPDLGAPVESCLGQRLLGDEGEIGADIAVAQHVHLRRPRWQRGDRVDIVERGTQISVRSMDDAFDRASVDREPFATGDARDAGAHVDVRDWVEPDARDSRAEGRGVARQLALVVDDQQERLPGRSHELGDDTDPASIGKIDLAGASSPVREVPLGRREGRPAVIAGDARDRFPTFKRRRGARPSKPPRNVESVDGPVPTEEVLPPADRGRSLARLFSKSAGEAIGLVEHDQGPLVHRVERSLRKGAEPGGPARHLLDGIGVPSVGGVHLHDAPSQIRSERESRGGLSYPGGPGQNRGPARGGRPGPGPSLGPAPQFGASPGVARQVVEVDRSHPLRERETRGSPRFAHRLGSSRGA